LSSRALGQKKVFSQSTRIRKLIEDLITKVERKAKGFSPDAGFLKVLLEGNTARKLYHVSMTLELPGKTLATQRERHDVEVGIKDAIAEIERQLKKYSASLRRENLWKRPARRENIRHNKLDAPPSEQRNREMFFSLISPHLNWLHYFVRHELASFQSMGDLAPGHFAWQDVVYAALLRAYREFVKDPARRDMRTWLTQIAIEQLQAEVKRPRAEYDRTVRIKGDIPETPPTEEVSTLGDEILDFYQPDEDLRLKDIVPDLEAPTHEQETDELRRCVKVAMAAMPREWQRALLLRYIEGLVDTELAKAIGKPEPEVERILEHARQYLRQRLMESSCRFKGSDGRTILPGEAEANTREQVAKRGASQARD
jgi:RNA polymerase sigma factor (sigma-70 family)